MTNETLESLRTNTLIGYTSKRGNAWWASRGIEDEPGVEPSHYDREVPVEDIIRRLFNWEYEEAEVYGKLLSADGVTEFIDPKHKFILRGDTHEVLQIAGSEYQGHSYKDWLVDAVEIAMGREAKAAGAGLLDNGGRAWVQIELPDTMFVEGDGIEPIAYRPFLTAATSLNGSLATTYLTGSQVVVCDNTLSAALGSATSKVKIRHTSASLDRLATATEGLELIEKTGERFAKQTKKLATTKVTDERWMQFVANLFNPGPNPSQRSLTMAEEKVRAITALWNYDPRVAPWAGTEYGVLAAVNTWTHHNKTVKGATRAERNVDRFITGGVDALDRGTLALLAKV